MNNISFFDVTLKSDLSLKYVINADSLDNAKEILKTKVMFLGDINNYEISPSL